MSTGSVISAIIGWAYFVAWSVSFYPQLILNYRRKSVEGLSLDFLAYNIIGFSCYATYTLSYAWWPLVQDEYKRRNDGRANLVAPNDVFFAAHAWVLTVATGIQALSYRERTHTISKFARVVIAVVLIAITVVVIWRVQRPAQGVLDIMNFLGTVKLCMSLIKYIPQMYNNFKDKSTEGWSIENIVLDATGGILSFAQLFLDAYLEATSGGKNGAGWLGNAFSGNTTKLGLSLLSLAFDSIFLVQHFVLYRGRLRPKVNDEKAVAKRGGDVEAASPRK
ncbi:hypothetical protein H9P43_004834 [Blastocladiella emersonii ATCC 22665]|nr:hypothetical protein H9P43_004834 [Blastocladiella emersonii ATCC 22665]